MQSASSRFFTARRRKRATRSPKRWWHSCSGCARAICSSYRGSPRRSTGRTAWWRSTASRSIRKLSTTPWACCSSTATTSSASPGKRPRAWSARRGPRPPPREPRMSAVSFFRRLLGGRREGVERPTHDLLSLCDALLSERGEYASAALARDALAAYQGLDERRRDAFCDSLARNYSPSPQVVGRAAAAYEAEHAIHGWRELRRRLESDRRCFAFFHPQLHDEPIIFIEVALLRGMSAYVQPLLDVGSPVGTASNVDCAMFYSITNCQEGLRGISFGNLLIKQVAENLKREFPHLRRFATLSPVPGFRRWLDENRMRVGVGAEGEERLALLSRLEDPAWHLGEVPEALQSLLMRLCAYYLLNAKQGLEPLDAVARFHLGNGASLERLNWMGDSSEQGMSRSAGLMVNYVYWLADVERNHERYFREHHIVASPLVEKLAREGPLAPHAEKGAAA